MSHTNPRLISTPRNLKDEPCYSIYVKKFKELVKEANPSKLGQVGGVEELAWGIGVDLNFGIDTSSEGQKSFSMKDRKEEFGENLVKIGRPRAPHPWTKALLKTRLLVPLIVAAMVTTILGFAFEQERENLGWIHCFAIWIVILIIVLTCVVVDYQLFLSQGELIRTREEFDVTVVRDGKETLIKNSDLLVGDILVLTKDAIVAADGVLFVNNDLVINEESISGETKLTKKKLIEDPFCHSGTRVTNGNGKILVTAVGEESELGKTLKMVTDSTDTADEWISSLRHFRFLSILPTMCLAILSFVVLLIHWMVYKKGFPIDEISEEGPVQFVILAVIIMVLELPKGYFLCILFLFVYLTWELAKSKVFVHRLDAFDEMSCVTSICFDKTGTLTENKMTVVEGWFHGTYFDRLPNVEELDPKTMELITQNACLNSEAFLIIDKKNGSIQFVGNRSECALLVMAKKFEVDYAEVRLDDRYQTIKNYVFDFEKKMSSVIVRNGGLLRFYNKGAAEIVLKKCTEYITPTGSICPISGLKRSELENTIKKMGSQGLRTLALTYVDLDPRDFNFGEKGEPLDEPMDGEGGFGEALEEKDLVLLAIVGIEDPVRAGVLEVVHQFNKADIIVRMITGDNIETAKRVARECGILTFRGLAMEAAEFCRRAENDIEGLKQDLPRLKVLARSSPSDKQKVVELLNSTGERVAVVGDDTNDARALKESCVGIAVGIDSTYVVKEASDVVILSNNVQSIMTFYLWSRCFDLNLYGYLKFRLIVTFVVWIVVLVSVSIGGETLINAHQFLWANFIIDTLVPLTIATESLPTKACDDGTNARKSPSKGTFAWHIVVQSLYQIIAIVCTFYSMSSLFQRYEVPMKEKFYYHRCYDGLSSDVEHTDETVRFLCHRYMDCNPLTRTCTFVEEQRFDDLAQGHAFMAWIEDTFEDERELVKMRKHSLIFNMFIFMQLFNALNCRKVLNACNALEGLFNSPLSCVTRLSTIGMQLIIMLAPVRTLFEVTELNAWEWLYSMAVGIGVMLLSTVTFWFCLY